MLVPPFAPLLAHEGWSLYGAQRAQPSGNRLQIPSGEGTQKQAKNVAVGCDRLPRQVHGKQGVCRGLPPVAGGPSLRRRGSMLMWRVSARLFVRAVRARALVAAAAAAGACLADHGEMIVTDSSRGPSAAVPG